MRYATELKERKLREPLLLLWVDHSYDHAQHQGVAFAINMVRGVTILKISPVPTDGTILIEAESIGSHPWEKLIDCLLKALRQQLNLPRREKLVHVDDHPWYVTVQ